MEPTRYLSKPNRLRWAMLVAAVIVVLLGVYLRVELERAGERLGVTYQMDKGGVLIVGVEPGSGAAHSGVAAGDRLLSVAGQPLREDEDFDRVASSFRRGVPVRMETQRGDERLQLTVVPGGKMDWGDFALTALATLLYLAVGLLASGRRSDDLRSTLLAAFCFAVAFELALPRPTALWGGARLAVEIAFLLITGIQFGLDLHLATILPAAPEWLARRGWVVRAFYVVGIGLGLFAASTGVAVALGYASVKPLDTLANGLIFTWLLPLWALALTGVIGARVFTFPDPRGRQQAGLVLMGVLPWVAVVLTDAIRSALDPNYVGFSDAVWNYALLAYPVAVFVAIYLYRLFDLELVVRKSFLYGTLTTLLVLGFYGLVGGVGGLAARHLGSEGVPLWVLSTAGLTMGLLFNPLRSRLQQAIDRRVFPERQALRSRLVALVAELPAQGKLPRMGEHLARELVRIFSVDPVTVWVAAAPQGQLVQLASSSREAPELEHTGLIGGDDPAVQLLERSGRPAPATLLAQASPAMAQRLAEVGAELVVPLVAHARLVGLLVLGRKREAQRFVAEELELLTLVGHHVATVFENARLFDSATYEGLTGLFRREALLEILDREWSRSQRYERPLAVAIADLDFFKEINDRHGHLTGDLVLQRVAAELRALLRETDFIGRFGGEEFLMVLPETTLEGARQFAEKVRQRIEELEIQPDSGRPIRVTLSIGVSSREEVRHESRARARALIAAADAALYGAKNSGRNRVEAAAAV